MDVLTNIDLGNLTSEIESMQITHEAMMAAAVASIVTGVLIGIFGLKLVRLISGLTGFLIGAVIGGIVAAVLGLTDMMVLAAILVGGVLFAVGGFLLRKVGMFIWVFVSVTSVIGTVAYQLGTIGVIAGAVVGLILAVLTVIFFEPLIIISTSIVGARSLSTGILLLVGMESNLIMNIIAFVVVLIVCVMVQFAMHSRKIQKKEEGQAREMRDADSREKEIEMARMFLDDDDL